MVGGGLAAVGDPDVGLLPQIVAPLRVVLQKLLAEPPEDGGVEGVDVVGRRREAHLGVGEVEDEVLPLVADVVVLEAEEEGQPVEEVHVGEPLRERRPTEVTDGAESGRGGADLGVTERRVVREEVVDRDYVVRLRLRVGPVGCRRRRRSLPVAHEEGESGKMVVRKL